MKEFEKMGARIRAEAKALVYVHRRWGQVLQEHILPFSASMGVGFTRT